MDRSIYTERREEILRRMAEDGFDALVIPAGADISYLTGFTGEAGVAVVVLSPEGSSFVTDSRYTTQVAEETEDYECVLWQKGTHSYCENAGMVLAKLAPKTVGIYGADLTYKDFLGMQSHYPQGEYKEAPAYLTEMRAKKTPQELDTIREACRISMLSFYALLDHIRPGVTEKDVADELEHQFRSHGGSGMCFDTIVASGPVNGACPHASVSDRVIQKGDFVTIDFGTRYHGYCSDITRTVAVGKGADAELYHIFDVVCEAKKAGQEALHAGLTRKELHETIEAPIKAAGYVTPHGFGHSFGLDIHELPFINGNDETPYEAGTITTIEPGIYVPGLGGVRQEDDYLICDGGYERLTFITDHLIEL